MLDAHVVLFFVFYRRKRRKRTVADLRHIKKQHVCSGIPLHHIAKQRHCCPQMLSEEGKRWGNQRSIGDNID